MKYPYRVEVYFGENQSKLDSIQRINRFLCHDTQGEYQKANITRKDPEYHSRFLGVELMFSSNADAVLFRMKFEDNGENIKTKILTDYQAEEKKL